MSSNARYSYRLALWSLTAWAKGLRSPAWIATKCAGKRWRRVSHCAGMCTRMRSNRHLNVIRRGESWDIGRTATDTVRVTLEGGGDTKDVDTARVAAFSLGMSVNLF